MHYFTTSRSLTINNIFIKLFRFNVINFPLLCRSPTTSPNLRKKLLKNAQGSWKKQMREIKVVRASLDGADYFYDMIARVGQEMRYLVPLNDVFAETNPRPLCFYQCHWSLPVTGIPHRRRLTTLSFLFLSILRRVIIACWQGLDKLRVLFRSLSISHLLFSVAQYCHHNNNSFIFI